MIMMSRVILLLLIAIISLAFLAGIVFLQVHLSKKESKWPGLILPVINFGMSMLIILGIGLYSVADTTTSVIYRDSQYMQIEITADRNDEPFASVVHHLADYGTINFAPAAAIMTILFMLMFFNIPTAILLIIYAVCRSNRRKLAALDMMSLQDL